MKTRLRRGPLPEHAALCEQCKASGQSAIAEKLPEEVPTPLEQSWRASRTRPLPTEYQLRAAKSRSERTRCADFRNGCDWRLQNDDKRGRRVHAWRAAAFDCEIHFFRTAANCGSVPVNVDPALGQEAGYRRWGFDKNPRPYRFQL